MSALPGAQPTATLVRDLRLIVRMASMLVQYLTVGGRVRREYRRNEARGEVYWVDAGGETQHREEALRRR